MRSPNLHLRAHGRLAVRVIAVVLWFGSSDALSPAADDASFTGLTLPARGKTGFTRLSPEDTGVQFTNLLDEWSGAANRVLENGSGTAVGDFDGDGWPDLFLCSLEGRNALFRNLGGWRFENVTTAAGLEATKAICRGAVFADLNGDAWLDLLVSTLDQGARCYLNDGQGRFTDFTSGAGTASDSGSSTLTLADVDGNGTLDLYVANYRAEDARDNSLIEIRIVGGRKVLHPKYANRLRLTPQGLREFGEPDVLYLNDGRGHFRAVPWTDGTFLDEEGRTLTEPPRDWGLTAAFRDINGDGWPDLYVCNDYWTPDRLWFNDGSGHFRLAPWQALRHTSENSMGVDFADLDRDGQVDLLVLDMLSRDPAMRKRQVLAQTPMPVRVGEIDNRPQIMRNVLFWNRGDGTFAEIADFAGLPASDWSWQPVFIDVDLDGYEDVLIPAGHQRDVQDLDATRRIKALQHPWPKNMDPGVRQEQFTREMMEHVRLYPPLPMPVVAFRNLGRRRFIETTPDWGTTEPGVHQGLALGDFDRDGDLDFVVNNLNGGCGLYRNDSIAPRVAVRLKGLPPNTQGIGARVTLRNGAVPGQRQELACGGRYLSGFEPLLVFAAGDASSGMSLEVAWRAGGRSVIPEVRPNRLYTIDEAGKAQPGKSTVPEPPRVEPPFFTDVSHLLDHLHVEDSFDDFARQPLLPRKLSQGGPGLAWFDLDGDGHDDLIVGSGRGGPLAVYRADGRAGFQRVTGASIDAVASRDQTGLMGLNTADGSAVVLVGSANYEDDGRTPGPGVRSFNLVAGRWDDIVPPHAASTGPLCAADMDGDGDLDLFVGGQVIPGRYPAPASSRVFRQESGRWSLDAANSQAFDRVGLVNGAVWSDLDGDGFPELVLACEWGPIRLFHNERGKLIERTVRLESSPLHRPPSTLDQLTGLWMGVTTGDFDGDGRLDIVAGNWGLNSPYRAGPQQPLRLYYGDLMNRGTVDLIETEFDAARQVYRPRHRVDSLAASMPWVAERFATFKAFGMATVDEALGEFRPRAAYVEARVLESTLLLNRGNGFKAVPLPDEAQFAPAFSVQAADFDGDGNEDVFLSQNFFAFPWEMHRLDAGRGLWLRGDGRGSFAPVPGRESGIAVDGEQRGAAVGDFNEDGRIDLVVSQNGAATCLFRNERGVAGLRVRLAGPPGNPKGIGASLRLKWGERPGPIREIHAGSGYWSQDSAVQVLGPRRHATEVVVRWPGGTVSTHPIPAGTREMTIPWAEAADRWH